MYRCGVVYVHVPVEGNHAGLDHIHPYSESHEGMGWRPVAAAEQGNNVHVCNNIDQTIPSLPPSLPPSLLPVWCTGVGGEVGGETGGGNEGEIVEGQVGAVDQSLQERERSV